MLRIMSIVARQIAVGTVCVVALDVCVLMVMVALTVVSSCVL